MLSMIANPVTALPVVYPRSGLSRSDLVLWPMTSDSALRRYFRTWGLSGHCADCREMCGRNLVTPRLSAAACAAAPAAWRCSPRCAGPRRG